MSVYSDIMTPSRREIRVCYENSWSAAYLIFNLTIPFLGGVLIRACFLGQQLILRQVLVQTVLKMADITLKLYCLNATATLADIVTS